MGWLMPQLGFVFFLFSLAAQFVAASSLPPEKQVFTMKFIDTTAGEAEIESLPPTTWNDQPAQHMRATVKTVGFFWWVYPFTQTVDVYMNPQTGAPLFVDINIQDRKKHQHTQIRLDSKTLRGEELEDSTEPNNPPSHRRKQWTISAGAHSIFSILNNVRMQPLTLGSQLSFPVAHDEKNGNFQAEVVRTEPLRVAGGERQTIVVRVARAFTDTFYEKSVREEPLFWFSNDEAKRLLRFEFKHRHGKVIAILKTPPG